MDQTLSKIDEIRSRTGVSYQQAKEALDQSEGDVIKALIYLESNNEGQSKMKEKYQFTEQMKEKSFDLGAWLKKYWDKFKEIRFAGERKQDGSILFNIPLWVSVLLLLFLRVFVLVTVVLMLVAGIKLYLILPNGKLFPSQPTEIIPPHKKDGFHS